MVKIRKRSILGTFVVVLGLFFIPGSYKALSMARVLQRPWFLEADLRSRIAECKKGPISNLHREELRYLEANVRRAGYCLTAQDGKMRLLRDYSNCVSKLFAAELEAGLLRMKLEQRRQNQLKLVRTLLPSLTLTFSGNGKNGKLWDRFNLNSIEEERSRKLLKEAKALYARDEIEPALYAALGALSSWNRFNHVNDARFARFSDQAERNRWNQHVNRLLEWSKHNGRRAVLVDKLDHSCILINKGKVQKRYRAELSRKWYQRKSQSRDASMPEGDYVVTRLIPRGKYGQALMLNYPNAEDEARFKALKRKGAISAGARIGGLIEIHGRGDKEIDWTDGCVALSDDDMRELYGFAYKGMPVTIIGTSRWTSGIRD